jgi:hypothetical protein
MEQKIEDYSVTMQDSTGKRCKLYINGDCIREHMESGLSLMQATEEVESNAFANAIWRKEIGADAWIAFDGADSVS